MQPLDLSQDPNEKMRSSIEQTVDPSFPLRNVQRIHVTNLVAMRRALELEYCNEAIAVTLSDGRSSTNSLMKDANGDDGRR